MFKHLHTFFILVYKINYQDKETFNQVPKPVKQNSL